MTRIKRKRFRRVAPARKAPAVERRAVTLSYPSGPRDVDAHVVGPLAVHRDCDVDASLGVNWCVTHVRTGGSIIGATARATFRQAMRIARECAAAPGVDWEFGEFGKKPASRISLHASSAARLAVRAAGIRAGLTLKRKEATSEKD